MKAMRFLISFVILFGASQAPAADDDVTRAMKLYEKRHFAEAASMLRASLPSIDPARQAAAQLTLGMIYLRNADLHERLYRQSLVVHLEYLRKLAAGRGRNRSRFANLYLAEALLEAGRFDQAIRYLDMFVREDDVASLHKAIAAVDRGLCYALQNKRQEAEDVWAGLDIAEPEIKSALAAAYTRSALMDKNRVALAEDSLSTVKKAGKSLSLRQIGNIISVYSGAGMIDKALGVVAEADLAGFSYRESAGKSKTINFYDLSLLRHLSVLYLKAGIAALEKAAAEGKLRETANFYLGEAYALDGKIDLSAKALNVFIGSSAIPAEYRARARVRQAANEYRKGRRTEALRAWGELSKGSQNVDLIAEILLSCGSIRINCGKLVKQAEASAEAGQGKRFSPLNIALGDYYLSKKEYSRALSYLEAGRDKGNKNKIESNDTVMLVGLAEAYGRTKKFSEALEIYFEMSKQFPEVRQIQEALQGIYAMEHKSAGDVKIN